MLTPSSHRTAGPVGHLWYDHLDSFTKSRFKLGTLRFVSTKVFADMFLFGPFYTSVFFVYMTCMTGGTLAVSRGDALVVCCGLSGPT